MGKTIKQIADELGVSKTSVRKKIDNLGLRSSLQLDGNQFAIDEEQEKLIKSAFSGDKSQTESKAKTQTESETVFTLVSILQEQLKVKDEQIERLQQSLNQAQQLQAIAEQKIKLLEQKQEDPPIEEPKRKWWQFWG